MASKSQHNKVVALFKPDTGGFSEWVVVNQFAGAGLKWSSNGNQRHGVFFTDRDFKWEKKLERGAVTHLRTAGWNKA